MFKIVRSIQTRPLHRKILKHSMNIMLYFPLINLTVPRECINTKNVIKTSNNNFTNKKADGNVTVNNFKQGKLGNCAMVSSMATLATNEGLYNKVVPKGQNFQKSFFPIFNFSKVAFNLYKQGKLHNVEVDKKLPIGANGGLIYGRSSNENLVGPLLEKALVQLHFDGRYEAARGVPATFVMASLSNSFFEEFASESKKLSSELEMAMEHGVKTNCQMVVCDDNRHAFALLGYDRQDEKKPIKLYDPHGGTYSVGKKKFSENLKVLVMSYYENKIFQMPEIKTSVEFVGNWPASQSSEEVFLVDYDLFIKEDDTEILMNVIAKPNLHIKPQMFIIASDGGMTVIKNSTVVTKDLVYHKASLRANLKNGKYKIVIGPTKLLIPDKSCEDCKKYLENGGSEFLFRLAASKRCSVEKSTEEDVEKIEEALKWHEYKLLFIIFSKKDFFVIIVKTMRNLFWLFFDHLKSFITF